MRIFLVLAAVFVAAVSAEGDEFLPNLEGMQSLTVFWDTPEELQILKSYEDVPGFDFLRIEHGSANLLVTAAEVEVFKRVLDVSNIDYVVTDENINENIIEQYISQQVARRSHKSLQSMVPYGGLPFTYYPEYDDINDYLEYISSNYEQAELIEIGTSYEGRSIKGLKISSGGGSKKSIFIDAGIHAREWIAPATALYTIDQLVVNETNKNLLRYIDWYIIPVVNPDGYQFTHSRPGNRLWRKTRSINPGTSCRGVDGNRNYDSAWNTVGASSNPCSDTYAGPRPASESEVQAVQNFILAQKGAIKLYLTLHSYGQYLLYPWGYTHKLPPSEPEHRQLAQTCAKAIAALRNTQYTYGTSANLLYPSSGGSDDWAMDTGRCPLAYTWELPGGRHGFMLPPDQIRPVGIETFEGIKVLHKHVLQSHF